MGWAWFQTEDKLEQHTLTPCPVELVLHWERWKVPRKAAVAAVMERFVQERGRKDSWFWWD